jgi:hypothetical protein
LDYFHGQYIVSVLVRILDFVHNFFDEVDAQTADFTLFEGNVEVGLFLFEWVEGRSFVPDFQSDGVVGNVGGEGYLAFSALGVGVHDDVGECLIQGEIDFGQKG